MPQKLSEEERVELQDEYIRLKMRKRLRSELDKVIPDYQNEQLNIRLGPILYSIQQRLSILEGIGESNTFTERFREDAESKDDERLHARVGQLLTEEQHGDFDLAKDESMFSEPSPIVMEIQAEEEEEADDV